MSALTPAYYLVHDTPAGQRFAYPTPAIPEAARQRGQDHQWSAPGARVVHETLGVRRNPWDGPTGGWIIADRPLDSLVLSWTVGAGMSNQWRKRTEPGGDDSVITSTWEQAGAEPTHEQLTHLNPDRGEHDEYDCLTCSVLRRVYKQVPAPRTPVSHTVDLSGWQPLPGTPDPDPSSTWTVADPSTLAVYGAHTAHLWPGALSGFRAAVVAALKAHPIRPSNVFDHDRNGNVSVHWSIAYDLPKPRKRHNGEKGRGPFYAKIQSSQHTEAIVPEALYAVSKAVAIEDWDTQVQAWVERFLPPVDGPVLACSHCNGAGFHIGASK